jgi:hypothetical protein
MGGSDGHPLRNGETLRLPFAVPRRVLLRDFHQVQPRRDDRVQAVDVEHGMAGGRGDRHGLEFGIGQTAEGERQQHQP